MGAHFMRRYGLRLFRFSHNTVVFLHASRESNQKQNVMHEMYIISKLFKKCFLAPHYLILVGTKDFKFSRLGTETPRLSVEVLSRNRNRYRNPGLKSLEIGLGTETQTFQVSESEPESKVRHFKSWNRNRN